MKLASEIVYFPCMLSYSNLFSDDVLLLYYSFQWTTRMASWRTVWMQHKSLTLATGIAKS